MITSECITLPEFTETIRAMPRTIATEHPLPEQTNQQIGRLMHDFHDTLTALARAESENSAVWQESFTRMAAQFLKLMPEENPRQIHAAYIATALARQLGSLPQESCRIGLATLVADVGLAMRPPQSHTNPNKHDNAADPQSRSHVEAGWCCFKEIEHPQWQDAALASRHHHEQWNGRGFPDGLAGAAIPRVARIASIALDLAQAHCVEAKPLHESLMSLVQYSNQLHDPEIVAAAIELEDEIAQIYKHLAQRAIHPEQMLKHFSRTIIEAT